MFIDSIHIERFAGLELRDFVFGRGVNIIEGDNETGKSSIAAFIRYLFYGFRDEEDRNLHVSLEDGSASGSLDMRTEGGRYRIERVTCRVPEVRPDGETVSVYREAVKVTDLENDRIIRRNEEPGQTFFGVDAEIFSGSAFVGQLGCTSVRGVSMRCAIENILFSASEDIDTKKAIELLEAQKAELISEDGKSGILPDLRKRREAADLRLCAAQETAQKIAGFRAEIAQTEKQRELNRHRIEQFREIRSVCEEYEKLSRIRNIEGVRERETAARNKADEIRKQLFRGDFVPDAEYVKRLRELASDIRHAQKAKEEAEKQLRENDFSEDDRVMARAAIVSRLEEWGGAEHVRASIQDHQRRRRLFTLGGIACVMLAVFAATLTAFLLFFGRDVKAYFVVTTAVFAACASFLFALRARHGAVVDGVMQAFNCRDEDDLETLFEANSVHEERLKMQTDTRRTITDKLSGETAALFDATTEAASMLDLLQPPESAPISPKLLTAEQIDTISGQLESALSTIGKWEAEAEKYAAIREQVSTDTTDPEEAEKRIAEIRVLLGDTDPDSIDLDEIRKQIELTAAQTEELGEKILEKKAQIADVSAQREDPDVLCDQVAKIDDAIHEAENKLAALELAVEKLEESGTRLRSQIAPTLSGETGKILASLSAEKYRDISLGADLGVSYESAEHGTLGAEYLSAGTKDLVYLALRFALVRTLYRETKPPLIFDESFSCLDDKRLQRILFLLYTEGQEDVQSFVLTCHKREREAAEQAGLCAVIHL